MQTAKEELDINKMNIERTKILGDGDRIEYPSSFDVKKGEIPMFFSPAEFCDVKMESSEDLSENDEHCHAGNSRQSVSPFEEESESNEMDNNGLITETTNNSTFLTDPENPLGSESIYKCEDKKCLCYKQKNLKRKSVTKDHQITYQCTHCSYAVENKSVILVHRRIHKKEKLYQCAHCAFATERERDLKSHLRTHKGETLDQSTHCNLKSLFQTVHNEETAIEFLKNINIIPKTKMCDKGHEMKISLYGSKPPAWRCDMRSCRTSIGLRKGTWLENSKLSYHNVVLFIYFWSREMNYKWCEHELNINCNTVTFWNTCLREVCLYRLERSDSMIGGEGVMVEIDESLFSPRKNNIGKIIPQQWIFGGLCRETKESFAVRVPDHTTVTLLAVVLQKVRPGSIVLSDRWEEYDKVSSTLTFVDRMISHRLRFVNPLSLANTKRVERVWGSKNWIKRRSRGSDKCYNESCLVEFMWRTKLENRDPFYSIMEDIVDFWTVQIQLGLV